MSQTLTRSLAPLVVSVAPGSPAESVGVLRRRRDRRASTATCPATSSNGRWPPTRPRWNSTCSRGGLDLSMSIEKPDGAPLGIEVSSAVFDRVRTCDNHCEFCFIYQLPKGMRRFAVPEGRRLSVVVPVRELHDAHPVHRGRSGAGGDRTVVAAARQHPRHRPRRPQRHAQEPTRGDEPALAAGAARSRHRREGPGRRVPRHERRRRARRHDGRHPRSLPRTRVGRRGAARHLEVQR